MTDKQITIRDIIKNRQTEVRNSKDLLPQRAAEILAELSALLGNCLDEIREADREYARVLLNYLDTETKANRAKIRAEISPEFQRKQEARNIKELCIELMRSLKYFIKSKGEEFQYSGKM